MITIIGVPMIENNLTFVDDQKLGGNDLIFINECLCWKETNASFWVFY